MSEQPTSQQQAEIDPQQQAEIDQLAERVATDLANGTPVKKIVAGLVQQGVDEPSAQAFVGNVQSAIENYRASPEGQRLVAARYRKHMWIGALWCIGGTLVTVFTYSAAASGGGSYVVAWGAIAFGGIEFLYGLGGWMRSGW